MTRYIQREREEGRDDRGPTGSSAAGVGRLLRASCKRRGLASGHRCSQPKYTNVNTRPIYTPAKPNRLSHHPWSIGLNYGEVTVPNDQHVARAGRIRRAAAFWPMWAVAGDTATASDGRGPVHLCHPATHHPIWRRKGILLAAGARHPRRLPSRQPRDVCRA